MTITCIIWSILGYLAGSIPFGLVLTRAFGLGDIRKIGSGNIGATNVLRTGRKDLALATVLLDASKAGIIALLAYKIVAPIDIVFLNFITTANVVASLLAGVFGVLGHNFPVWLKFKGGKGVASTFGFILFTSPMTALFALGVWLVMAFKFRYSSLAAVTACVITPCFAFFVTTPIYMVFYSAIALLVIIRHRENIIRLFKGQESKIKLKK